jgi:penicillin-binding protein 1C
VKDLLAALGPISAQSRPVPPNVHAQDICWPLGLAASAIDPAHCAVRRSAWTLDDTAPPTLPDRVNPHSLLDTAWVDSQERERLRPGCQPGNAQHAVEYARWPTLLQPWIEPAQRSAVERLPLGPPCAHQTPSRSLRITGIDPGSVLHAVPGKKSLTLQLQALGTTEPVVWLLDGRWVGSTQQTGTTPGSLRLPLAEPGPHALTAMDSTGRFEQVRFAVR